MTRTLLVAGVALLAQGSLALNAGPLVAMRPAVTATRGAILDVDMASNNGYKKKPYLERLAAGSSAAKGRKAAQIKREAAAAAAAAAAEKEKERLAAEAAAEAAEAPAEEAAAE